jgi:hypothetical protein
MFQQSNDVISQACTNYTITSANNAPETNHQTSTRTYMIDFVSKNAQLELSILEYDNDINEHVVDFMHVAVVQFHVDIPLNMEIDDD